jgi:hypothetical protein
MAVYLPVGWKNKRVSVRLLPDASDIEATVVDENAGGVQLEGSAGGGPRRIFVPWTSVQYLELLQEPDA